MQLRTTHLNGAEPRLAAGERNSAHHLTRKQVLELYFLEARAKLIDLAAFLDRMDRAVGEGDFRLTAFRKALKALGSTRKNRAAQVLTALSDPTIEPLPAATTKGACGAWSGKS